MKTENQLQQIYYKAHLTRDARFDGKFFVAVKSTGIYCRPICPARKAQLTNLTFYQHAIEAENAGYRPCIRCRPESAPGSAAWQGTHTTVKRAVKMIEQQANQLTIKYLAEQLGVSDRWLRQLFKEQLGINPQQLLLDKKLSFAKHLLDHSEFKITDIAYQAGFQSVRRFNDAYLKKFKCAPSMHRKNTNSSLPQTIQLNYRPPLDKTKLLGFFKFRELAGVEYVTNNSYERILCWENEPIYIKIVFLETHAVQVYIEAEKSINLYPLVARIKKVFDLDCDPLTIEQQLKQDKKLKPFLEKHKGIRIPGCFDDFELIVRAIIGQRISVKAAQTILKRFVDQFGKKFVKQDNPYLYICFPSPKDIAKADLNGLGLPQSKIHSIKAIAQMLHNSELDFSGLVDDTTIYQKLLSIKGIGAWTAQYIAMRLLKDPNAFPEKDLELLKQINAHDLDPNVWEPWRAYVTILLFSL